MKGERIGLLGGTFNPIHIGHLLLAEQALGASSLDRVLLVPNRVPPHRRFRAGELASSRHRFNMCQLAVLSNPRLAVSNIELLRDGPSYTYDTVCELKRLHPENAYCLVTGADSLTQHTWHRFAELLALLDRLIVTSRPGTEPVETVSGGGINAVRMKVKQESPQSLEKIQDIQMPSIEVSATWIRERVQKGESIRYWVPEPVQEYIYQNALYAEAGIP